MYAASCARVEKLNFAKIAVTYFSTVFSATLNWSAINLLLRPLLLQAFGGRDVWRKLAPDARQKFPKKPRLSDAGFTPEEHDATVSLRRILAGFYETLKLDVTSDKLLA